MRLTAARATTHSVPIKEEFRGRYRDRRKRDRLGELRERPERRNSEPAGQSGPRRRRR